MRMILAGARGQLAHEIVRVFGPRAEIHGLDLPEWDITSREAVHAAVRRIRPEVIVNAAAFTAVDACETEPDVARRVNADGPAFLAEAARDAGSFLVHISTDYVFDGRRPPPEPYRESDPTGPCCHYGVTKLAGEDAVRQAGGRHAIVRTAWMYGVHGRNFPKTMLRMALGSPEREIRVVNDQHGSPTWAWRLARQIETLLDGGRQGTFHATAEGHTTWYEYAIVFLQCMGVAHRIVPCTTADYPTPARRPANSILENQRLKEAGIHRMVDWRADVEAFAGECRGRLLEEARR